MKIGITGGTGFIGKYLLKVLAEKNKLIVTTSRDFNRKAPNIIYKKVDYSKEQYIDAFAGCDAVVHLGARIQYDLQTGEQSFTMYLNNVISCDNVLKACKECGITNVVMASSIAVYNKDPNIVYNEESETIPLTYYGHSKVCCEKLAEMYNVNYGMKIKSLRLGYVYGYNADSNVKNSLIMFFLNKAKNREPLPLFGDGNAANMYIYVKDAVEAIKIAVSSPLKSGAYNIANDECTTAKDFAECFCIAFPGVDYFYLSDKKYLGNKWYLSNKKAECELGFRPQYSILDAVYDMKNIAECLDII